MKIILRQKKVTGKKIIWSNLFKPLKDTISKTDTCFRQHHDSFRKTFQKDFVTVILKAQKSLHMTKFLVICNNPRIASTKTQSIFCNNMSFLKDKDSEKTNISWYLNLDIRVLLRQKKKIFFRFKTLNLWRTERSWNFTKKLSRKRWQVINFPPLSFQNSSRSVLELKLFNRFYIWYFETNISFQNSSTQISFLKTMIEHES